MIQKALQYVISTSHQHKIDESHALKHSLEVLHLSNTIYRKEVVKHPFLAEHQNLIYMSAILHDMCDKKYMSEKEGVAAIQNYLAPMMGGTDVKMVGNIITTMSYSTVKKYGYPDLGQHQLAYHIVREADLLTAYDIDRCIIYSMFQEKLDYKGAVERTMGLFDDRVLKYRSDGLFETAYSRNLSLLLHDRAVRELDVLRGFL